MVHWKAECLQERFTRGYLKGRNAKTYVHEVLKQRIELGLDLSVLFIIVPKEHIEIEEIKAIRKACPWLNKNLDPRGSIRGFQRQMGKIVEDSEREGSYEEIMKHLFY